MASYAKFRSLPTWVGVCLLVPAVVVAATGILWNHERTLGLAPDPMMGPKRDTGSSLLRARPGTWNEHSSAIDRALLAVQSEWGEGAEIEKIELRNDAAYGTVVKVRATRPGGPEEVTWSVADSRIVNRRSAAESGNDWAKVVHDLHTGRFFSTRLGFVWSDGVAVAVLLLGGSGLVMFLIPTWKRWSRRRKVRRSQLVSFPTKLTQTP